MKFMYKVTCCPCYDAILTDFNCLCDLNQDIYVLKCADHPFVHRPKKDTKCFSKNLAGSQICGLCLEKRLVLNYEAKKHCFKKLPSIIEDIAVGFEEFLKDIKSDVFFIFENNFVFCCLENYNYKEIIDNFDSNPGN